MEKPAYVIDYKAKWRPQGGLSRLVAPGDFVEPRGSHHFIKSTNKKAR
jgi:hypothetical protein